MVKVSFIIPAYNVEPYIEKCIKSIINQTEKDTQIIIVDDGSTDRTPIICDDFLKKDDRVIVIHQENAGPSSARLRGFLEAKGKYILFVDGDDYVEPDFAETLISSAEQNNSDVVLCGYFTNDKNFENISLLPFENETVIKKENIEELYIQPYIGNKSNGINLPRFLCFKLYRKDIIKEEYFKHEEIFYSEDVVFNLLLTDNIGKISVVNKPLYHYRINPDSLSNRYRENKWQKCKNLYNFLLSYLEERNIPIDNERLLDTIYECIFVSIDNAVISGTYKTYLKEIRQIESDTVVREKLSLTIPIKSFSIKLSLALLNHKQFLLLYIIRKYRLKLASRI